MAVVPLRAQRTLARCAEDANAELLQVQAADQDALDHAIRCGEALNEARAQCGHGAWLTWLSENFLAEPQTARTYMRLARRQDDVRAAGAKSITQADRWIAEHSPKFESQADRARELRSDGLTQVEIARVLGVSQATVTNWLNPDQHRRQHKAFTARVRREEAAQARRVDRDRAMAQIGGEVSQTYGAVRRTIRSLELAIDQAPSERVKQALAQAWQTATRLEDEVVAAARIARPDLSEALRSKRGD